MVYSYLIGRRPATNQIQPMTLTALFITDEVTACDCCGKKDLKATVAMLNQDGGLFHYGRTCAARNSGKASKQINKEIKLERANAHGRCDNALLALRRAGTKITREVVAEVAQAHPAVDLQVLIRNWA